MKLGNFGEKKGLWQSQDNIYLKEFAQKRVALGKCLELDMQFENTISCTASWSNNPNLRAKYKQVFSKVVSQLQNANQV